MEIGMTIKDQENTKFKILFMTIHSVPSQMIFIILDIKLLQMKAKTKPIKI